MEDGFKLYNEAVEKLLLYLDKENKWYSIFIYLRDNERIMIEMVDEYDDLYRRYIISNNDEIDNEEENNNGFNQLHSAIEKISFVINKYQENYKIIKLHLFQDNIDELICRYRLNIFVSNELSEKPFGYKFYNISNINEYIVAYSNIEDYNIKFNDLNEACNHHLKKLIDK